jgi:peroxiredoxin
VGTTLGDPLRSVRHRAVALTFASCANSRHGGTNEFGSSNSDGQADGATGEGTDLDRATLSLDATPRPDDQQRRVYSRHHAKGQLRLAHTRARDYEVRMRTLPSSLSSLALVVFSAACDHAGETSTAAPPPPVTTTPASAGSAHTTGAVATLGHAEVGKSAPDFTLSDLDGHSVHLADLKGKTVVLEWFNPGCPFVRKAHTKGSLVGTAKRYTDQGVVWLAINSAAPGREGYGATKNAEGKHAYGMEYPILLDESGDVGHAYGATNTPHMFVIDKGGTLVYRGAIDNSPDAEGESPTGGKLVNYVEATIADLAAGRAAGTPSTEAYGCSVKYGHP